MSRLKSIVKGWFRQLSGNSLSDEGHTCGAGTLSEGDHYSIPRDLISHNALKVLQRLNDHGYQAYLVGGCIRDLLLGLHPKDFDVATNAHPEEVRRLFRNSRMIGRRFKLIHVLFGRETIEVATFRASHVSGQSQAHALQDSESGRILRDNVYGSIEDDAARRDFTVNALYYSDNQGELVDFSSGLSDLQNKTLRLLGDPETRYREDPVRMLRAARFAAKLDFTIEASTEMPIRELASLLDGIPEARLFDEILKLFLNGDGLKTLHMLQALQLFSHLFPSAHVAMNQSRQATFLLEAALKSTDHRVNQQRPVTPAFLFAALLWHPMQYQSKIFLKEGMPVMQAVQEGANDVIREQCLVTAIPKRFSFAMRDIWELQHRLVKHHPKKIESIVSHPRFRAAYDFLLLRETSGESLGDAGAWWTAYQEKHPVVREHNASAFKPRRRPRRRRNPGAENQHSENV